MTVRVLSAGAAKGLVGDVQTEFEASSGVTISGFFSAVGAIRERFESGEACDVLILTARQLAELEAAGSVRGMAPIGTVRTAVAVPADRVKPDVSTGPAFAAAMRVSSAVYMPDAYKSTAGIHVRSVLAALGLEAEMAPKLRMFPNGETAMRTLAEEAPEGGIGTTQMTEILYTPGLELVGPLPPEHDLSTVYAAAVSTRAVMPGEAEALVALLTGAATARLRQRSGFE
ncbi:MAG: molybdate ABC transporter substrate-binding protein [Janthinobacterium lividum]